MRQTIGGNDGLHIAPLRSAGGLISARVAAIVTDETVAALYFDELASSLRAAGTAVCKLALPAGERIKNQKCLFELYGWLSEAGVSRQDVIIALGGGSVGDLAGFAAATYLRGVRLVNCPTTLLAQCDSAIGGKTGIDLPSGKNLVGAFYPAEAVIADPATLQTLPASQLASGTAEVIKCACIADKSLLGAVAARDLPEMVRRSAEIKLKYVALDPLDRGARHALNFGHTIGHAVEALSGGALPHGCAVAIGMAAMAKIGERLGVTEAKTASTLQEILAASGLPNDISAYRASDLVPFIARDKKAAGDDIKAVLLKRLGEATVVSLPHAKLEDELSRLCL